MSREVDGGTGLYYVRNRWYDVQLGRFLSEDPIGLGGGINWYAYAANSPTNLRDPFGLCPNCHTVVVTVHGCSDPTWTRGDDGKCRSARGSGRGAGGRTGGGGDGVGAFLGGAIAANQAEQDKGCLENVQEFVIDGALTALGLKSLGILGHAARARASGRAAGQLARAAARAQVAGVNPAEVSAAASRALTRSSQHSMLVPAAGALVTAKGTQVEWGNFVTSAGAATYEGLKLSPLGVAFSGVEAAQACF